MKKHLATLILSGALIAPTGGWAGNPVAPDDNWKPATPKSEPAPTSRVRGWLRSLFSKRGDKNKSEPMAGDKKSRDEVSDLELANRARAALYQDHILASYNLEVTVQDGVATVSGPVPSDGFRHRAVATLKKLSGIKDVRDQLRIRATPTASQTRPRIFPPVDDPQHVDPQVTPSAPPPRELIMPAPPLIGKPVGRSGWNNDPVGWVPAGTSQKVMVRSGVQPPTLGTDLQSGLQENRGTPRGDLAFAFAVQRIIATNGRFRGVTFETEGRRIQLSGSVELDADRDDLLRALQAMDGVDDVNAGSVRVEAP